MRDLIEPRWRRRVRLGRALDYFAVVLTLALALFFVGGWLFLAARLDCAHRELKPQLPYCSWFER